MAGGVFELGANVRPRLLQYGSEPLEGAPEDEANWRAAVSLALRALHQREKFPTRDCVLAVPGHLALTKFVRTPAVARDKRDRIVQFEAAQNIPHPLDEVAWGYAEISDDGVDLELMLAAVKLDAMEALCAAVEKAGFVVTGAEPASLALCRSCSQFPEARTTPSLVVDVGARSTQLVFTGGAGVFTRTLPLGGTIMTHTLAEDLHLDFRAAEALKLEVLADRSRVTVDEVTRTAVNRARDGFMGRLQLEITRSRLGYSRQPGAVVPTQVWLTGAGSNLPEIAAKLKAGLDLPVARLDTVSQIDLTDRAKLDGAAAAGGHLAVLTGLALGESSVRPSRLDLLPSSRHAVQVQRHARPWWLAAAALTAAALLAPLAFYQVRAAHLQSQSAAYERQLAPLRRLAAGNASNLDRLHELQRQAKAIEGVANSRTNWVAFLADLQQRLGRVGDVWLESMQVLPSPDSGPTDAGGGGRAAGWLWADGCSIPAIHWPRPAMNRMTR